MLPGIWWEGCGHALQGQSGLCYGSCARLGGQSGEFSLPCGDAVELETISCCGVTPALGLPLLTLLTILTSPTELSLTTHPFHTST